MERAGRAGRAGDDVVEAGDVVARAQAGDERAWGQLADVHLRLVHAICRGHGLHDEPAAEVNQLMWLQLVEHLPRIRTPEAIGGWIAATTRSLCLAPGHAGHRSGYVAAAIGRPPVPNSNGRGHADPPAASSPTEGDRLAAAFARIGARCQRLLRLVVTRPHPTDEDVSAALDLPLAEIEPACIGCADRLRRLAAGRSGRSGTADASGAAGVPDVLAELQQAIADSDPVPDAWCDAARAAYAWRTLDGVAAQRVYDATVVVGRDDAAGFAPHLPSVQTVRRLRFSSPDEDVELVVDGKGDEVLLAGRLAAGRDAEVTARWPGGQRSTRSDDTGAFRLSGLPVAPLCLHVAGTRPVKTGWILPTPPV